MKIIFLAFAALVAGTAAQAQEANGMAAVETRAGTGVYYTSPAPVLPVQK